MNILSTVSMNVQLMHSFIYKAFPLVSTELRNWSTLAQLSPCSVLQKQALLSITHKKFHCQGGSIYSLYPGVKTTDFITLVVALQTISDYLDNLCDRAGIADEQAFRQLHLAMSDAINPEAIPQNYYAFYPFRDDGGYLTKLVTTCQQEIVKLPSYPLVKPYLLKFAGLYSDLQTYKHLDLTIREQKMLHWMDQYKNDYPHITNWEFAAATGSTLGMFMLCAAASNKNLTSIDANKIFIAYFPWICGLHIQLDYFIDSAEDKANGDLNFVAYYNNEAEILSRLTCFTQQALQAAKGLPEPHFHKTVVQGLLAMYLSDPKINCPKEQSIKKSLLKTAGSYTTFMYLLCKLLRYKRKL